MTNFIKMASLALVAVLVVGCQTGGPTPGAKAPAAIRSEIYQPSSPAFYYFAAAQFKLKQGDVNEAIWLLEQAIRHDPGSAYLKLEMANLLLIKKESDKALALVEQVIADDPDNIQALTLAGSIYQEQKKTDQATQAYEKVIALHPTDQNIYLLLGRIYWNKNDLENAERVFWRMKTDIPDSYAAYYFYGKVLSAEGKFDSAETALLKSLELEPSLDEPRLELLKIYKLHHQTAKIVQTYKAILQYDPQNYKAAFELAEQYRLMDQKPPSLKLLHTLGRQVRTDGAIISTLFELYIEPKQYKEAMWALEGMLQAAPGNSELHYLAGIASDNLGHNEQAFEHLAKVKPDSKFYNNAVVQRALLYHDLGKIDRAIKVVQNALLHDPSNADYYLYLGSFYEELERYDEAAKVLREGLEKDEKNPRLHFRLGVVYDKMGRKENSISAIKAVLRLTPNDAEALNYLGYTYADMGINLDEAQSLIQTALKLKPDDGYITDSLGWVYFKRGEYQQALKWLNKAVELVPDDPVILEHIGDVYLKMKSREKAMTYYERSLKKKAKDRKALEKKIRTLEIE